MSIPRSPDGSKTPAASSPGPAWAPWWALQSPDRLAAARLGLVSLLVALAAPCSPALAAADTAAVQRERIARERAIVERETQAARAACNQQFAVTACVDRVKADRGARLQRLDHERAVLDDELRKRRAAERIAQIQQRQAQRAAEAPSVSVRTRSPAASAPRAAPARSTAAAAAAHEAAASLAQAEASQRAAASARRASEVEAHRIAVEKRNREREKQRGPARPLPVPPDVPASR